MENLLSSSTFVACVVFSTFNKTINIMSISLATFNLAGSLAANDYVGFTFFIGYMAMFAASVFFFFERSQVEGK